ncbi:MAG: ABC-F family ATP-binding cassette domain-containing protein [Bacteroidota bacterium]
MLQASNIFIKYGDRVLFDQLNLTVGPKDKIGLVGRNGAGKSTMLKVLAREVTPDGGRIECPNGQSIGFLHQEMDLPKGKTVIQETLSAFAEIQQLEARLDALNLELQERTDYESDDYLKLLQKISDTSDRFHFLGGDNIEAEAEKVLSGLGFKARDFQRLTDEFSGGWQMRIELTKMLLQKPDFLLLDEPTNHLDIESILWLEEFLKGYSSAIVVISHDKTFLDNITKSTVEIELGKIYEYKAPYSKYVELRKERRELLQSAYQNQQKVIAQKERTINRFMAKATKTKMAQSMKKQLDKLERIELDEPDSAAMRIKFPPAPRSGQVVIEAKAVSKRYGDLSVLENINLHLDRGDRLAFVGQNGQGKTTLAKILVNELTSSGGEVKLGHNAQIGYYAQNQAETLDASKTLLQTLEAVAPPEMRTRVRAILGAFLFSGEDVDKKVSVLSGGERARLAMACMLLKPFNLLVLDEPTNHLDMISKDILKQALQDYDGTLIVVSHDRDFLADLTNRTIEFRDRQLYEYLGDVQFFLEKRALQNMRQVELQKSKSGTAAKAAAPVAKAPLTQEERQRRKELQRAVQNSERKITRLEERIAKREVEMGEAGFYDRPEAQDLLAKYERDKKELDEVMDAWETAQLELEELEG